MTAAVVVGLSWLALVWGMEQARWKATDPLGLALLISGVFLVARPTVLVLGLDTPFPDDVFMFKDVDSLVVRSQVVVIVWLLVLPPVARFVARNASVPVQLLAAPTDRQVRAALVPLAIAATAVTVPLWVRYGGPTGLTTAAKTRGLPDSLRMLRAIPVAAAFFGAATVAFGTRTSTGRATRSLALVVWVLGAGLSYSFGARDAAIAPLILPLVRALDRPRHLNAAAIRRTLRNLPRIAIIGCVLILVTVGLRAWRDITLTGQLQGSIRDRSVVRQASVAANLTQYDALMIVTAYSGNELQPGGPDVVVDSFLGSIPGLSRNLDTPAVTVAKFTDERRTNGYPLSAAGEWAYALGLGGVALGAALSGIVLGLLESWRRRFRADRVIAPAAFLLLWGTTIAPGGVWLTSPGRFVSIGVPTLLIGLGMRLVSHQRSRPPAVFLRPDRSSLT